MVLYEDFHIGHIAFGCGLILSITTVAIASLSLVAGLSIIGLVGLLYLLCEKKIIKSDYFSDIMSVTLIMSPILLVALQFLLTVFSGVCWLIVLLL